MFMIFGGLVRNCYKLICLSKTFIHNLGNILCLLSIWELWEYLRLIHNLGILYKFILTKLNVRKKSPNFVVLKSRYIFFCFWFLFIVKMLQMRNIRNISISN